MPTLPATQVAIQLTGPDRLELTQTKAVTAPGPRQILGRVECVGLCQSDMKLLHQFSGHARKTPVLAHLTPEELSTISSYVPDSQPTVPGHEVVVQVVAVGAGVTSVEVDKRYLVQADWRDLRTAGSNGAFGYNFEGGLQQYVILDERVTVAKDGTSYLIPIPAERSASQIALVEPWACVEDAFIHRERRTLKAGGTALVVLTPGAHVDLDGLNWAACGTRLVTGGDLLGFTRVELADVKPNSIDDLAVIGADPDLLDRVLPLVANGGIVSLATGGKRYRRNVRLPIGRVHYGNLRFAGTVSSRPGHAYQRIPVNGEVRIGDHVQVVGAAGPMGQMAVIRLASLGRGLSIEAFDRNSARVQTLRQKAEPVALARGVQLRCFDATVDSPAAYPDYTMIMVPVPTLVSTAVNASRQKGIINIFAGIPADVWEPIDVDLYIGRNLYFIGTSGSTMEDMESVLSKVLSDTLDTNLSVGAVSGMAGAIQGLQAVKAGTMNGKILVYPHLPELPLIELDALAERYPSVAAKLVDGAWTKEAEAELLRVVG
jgi:threonine dehydrogenase-like Zn-dependent dehydrogenase